MGSPWEKVRYGQELKITFPAIKENRIAVNQSIFDVKLGLYDNN